MMSNILTLLLSAVLSSFTLSNGNISVTIAPDGSLESLMNVKTGHDYASGGYLWRLYYDCPQEKEIQIVGAGQTPAISSEGNTVTITYDSLVCRGETLPVSLELQVVLEDDKVRFCSSMTNNMPGTVLREFQYPLLRGTRLPSDHKLYTSEAGGKLTDFNGAYLSVKTVLKPSEQV